MPYGVIRPPAVQGAFAPGQARYAELTAPPDNRGGVLLRIRIFLAGVGVPDDPSGKFDLDGQIFPYLSLPLCGSGDVEDAIPYGLHSIRTNQPSALPEFQTPDFHTPSGK